MKYFNSCLCCSLRVGNIVYGTYAVIVGFLAIIGTSILLAYYDDDSLKDFAKVYPRGMVISLLVCTIVGEIVNVLLLYGVLKKIPKLMFPWIIICGITLALQFVATIMAFIAGQFSIGIGYLLGIALSYLIFHCILSYYKELQQVTPTNMDSNRHMFAKV